MGTESGRVFPGIHALLGMIRGLYDRPGFLTVGADSALRGDQPLPLVCLIHDEGAAGADFLAILAERFDVAPAPQVPHVLLDAATAADQSRQIWRPGDDPAAPIGRQPPLLPLLDVLRVRIASTPFGSKRLTRFDNYRLADALTGAELSSARNRDDRAPILAFLRTWVGAGGGPDAGVVADVVDAVPTATAKLGARILLWLGRKATVRALSDWVPGLRREARWFLREQHFMVPEHSVGFLGFAERLTPARRESESLEQLKRLLVHAFLEDLRIAYRRTHRLPHLPRVRGHRATAYVTVLLDNVTAANGGWELLRLINAVRNETGLLDPLLVIVGTSELPPLPEEDLANLYPPVDAEPALDSWRRALPSRRQRLTSDARYLLFRLPDAAHQGATEQADRNAWHSQVSYTARRPPRLARRRVVAMLTALVVAIALLSIGAVVRDSVARQAAEQATLARYRAAGCSTTGPFPPGLSITPVNLGPQDAECIGYSDSDAQIFGTSARLSEDQRLVFAQNAIAERLHADTPNRPFVSLVYFAGLTHSGANPDTDAAVAEELEGILIRQRQQNDPNKSQPLLRVIVANGGYEMARADQVVSMLATLFRADASVLAVVGMDRTVTQTKLAIADLGRLGIPVVATTLTGTGLVNLSPLYFQVIAGNEQEAHLVGLYARSRHDTTITVYHPALGQGDQYEDTLVADLLAQRAPGLTVTSTQWAQSGSGLGLGSLCGTAGGNLAFFAGRETDFYNFLDEVANGCHNMATLPPIIADDAVSRFVENETDRRQDALNGVPISYVTEGGLVVLAGSACLTENQNAQIDDNHSLAEFCAGYSVLHADLVHQLPTDPTLQVPWAGERVGRAYDAVGMVIADAAQLGPELTRAGLAESFRDDTFIGATGEIDMSGGRDGAQRNIAILGVSDIHDVTAQPTCEYMIGETFHPVAPGHQNDNECGSG